MAYCLLPTHLKLYCYVLSDLDSVLLSTMTISFSDAWSAVYLPKFPCIVLSSFQCFVLPWRPSYLFNLKESCLLIVLCFGCSGFLLDVFIRRSICLHKNYFWQLFRYKLVCQFCGNKFRSNDCSMMGWMQMWLLGVPSYRASLLYTLLLKEAISKWWIYCLNGVPILMLEPRVHFAVSTIIIQYLFMINF